MGRGTSLQDRDERFLADAIFSAQAEIRGEKPREIPAPEMLVEQEMKSQPVKRLRRNPDQAPQPKPRPNRRGKLALWADGVERNLSESWQYVFAKNSIWKLSDLVLLQRMATLFPGVGSRLFQNVKKLRAMYNSGKLAGMASLPKERSYEYRERGGDIWAVNARGTSLRKMQGARREPKLGGGGGG